MQISAKAIQGYWPLVNSRQCHRSPPIFNPCPYTHVKLIQIPAALFKLSCSQTDKHRRKHNLLGGGNYQDTCATTAAATHSEIFYWSQPICCLEGECCCSAVPVELDCLSRLLLSAGVKSRQKSWATYNRHMRNYPVLPMAQTYQNHMTDFHFRIVQVWAKPKEITVCFEWSCVWTKKCRPTEVSWRNPWYGLPGTARLLVSWGQLIFCCQILNSYSKMSIRFTGLLYSECFIFCVLYKTYG